MRVIMPYAILVIAIAVAPRAHADSPADLQKVITAEQKWISLGAVSYEYTLGVSVGAAFGWGEFKVTVKNGVCTSRQPKGTSRVWLPSRGQDRFRQAAPTEAVRKLAVKLRRFQTYLPVCDLAKRKVKVDGLRVMRSSLRQPSQRSPSPTRWSHHR
jgi:hypothetical protein